jgi:hypothetical protein
MDAAMTTLSKGAVGTGVGHHNSTITKSFRLPKELAQVLAEDAQTKKVNVTDLLVSILTRYALFDRNAEKFGFLTINRDSFKALINMIPEERIKEAALVHSVGIEEFVEFWFKKKDLGSLLKAIDIMSKYLGSFEYTTSRSDHELTITMRTDLGRKFALFLGMAWEKGTVMILGAAPRVDIEENQVNLTLATGVLASDPIFSQ